MPGSHVSGGDLPPDAFATGQDEPILLIDFRRIAAVLVPGLQRDVAVKAIFVQYVGEALAAFLVY